MNKFYISLALVVAPMFVLAEEAKPATPAVVAPKTVTEAAEAAKKAVLANVDVATAELTAKNAFLAAELKDLTAKAKEAKKAVSANKDEAKKIDLEAAVKAADAAVTAKQDEVKALNKDVSFLKNTVAKLGLVSAQHPFYAMLATVVATIGAVELVHYLTATAEEEVNF